MVREKALSTVVQAAEMALPVDLAAAGDLVNQAERIDPSSSSVATIKATLATRKRDAVVAQQLSSDQKLETMQDLEAALTHLKPALADYPDEPRLLERKRMLETRVMAAKAAREREKRSRNTSSLPSGCIQAMIFPVRWRCSTKGSRWFPTIRVWCG